MSFLDKYSIGGIIFFSLVLIAGLISMFLWEPPAKQTRHFCLENTPKNYELTNSFYDFGGDQVECFYETSKEFEYGICFKKLIKTENHGYVKVFGTCGEAIT